MYQKKKSFAPVMNSLKNFPSKQQQ